MKATEQIASVAIAIIGVATLAVLVGKKSKTAEVIKAAGGSFSDAIKAAVSPVI